METPSSPVERRKPGGMRRPAIAVSRCAVILFVAFLPAARPVLAARPFPAPGDSLSYPLAVSAGWNLFSIPLIVDDPSKASLFPGSTSNAFVYDGAYSATDTLSNGIGFWLKFPAAETVTVGGRGDFRDTIELRAGWNLIGGISTPAAAGVIRSDPPGLVASRYFTFAPGAGYVPADTLRPGAGYMVKASSPGLLILTSLNVPCPGVAPVVYEGGTYHGVQIADQCWFRENLNAGRLQWAGLDQTNDGVIERYCWIDDSLNCIHYGALYQWDEAMQYSTVPGSQGICPPGWHIPTLGEFKALDTVTLGNANHIKALRQGDGDGAGTNLTGFGALLSGYRHLDGTFSMLGFQTYYWTSTEHDPETVPGLYLFYYHSDYFFYNLEKGYGLNIRCLKD
jgi:uncharacterized protein (TIGR02145 family)